ncbi:MAG: DNA recombination protein RmuC [Giesbergeria sp.]
MSSDTWLVLGALALGLVVLLLLVLLLRQPRVQLPTEWLARLQALEQAGLATQLAVAKNDGALDAMGQQLRAFTQTTQVAQESLRQAVDERLAQAVGESRAARGELASTLAAFRTELVATTGALAAESVKSREALAHSSAQAQERIQERFEALTQATRQSLDSLKADIHTQLLGMANTLRDQLSDNSQQLRTQFSFLQESVHQQLSGLVQGSQQSAEQLRTALNERLAAIQTDNATKLEEMRRTVDEKLHATLEQRLGESFKLVSDRLEQVHKGLGEMQTLAGSVGDLKRVMTNVKSRGTWGEMQLGAIIDNVLTPDQFGRNVKTVPDSDEMVEYAIRLPGKSHETPVWLPIDAKYPVEQYQRLLDAQEAADKPAIASAGNAFEASIRLEAKKICAKYVSPPHTTDFAVLYLPSEGLFAEVMRRPGLVEAVQNDCRVMITGPANLAAMLNSLQMGFKTLAIEKRSSEVWALLGTVKTEFSKFGEVVEATKKSIDAAAKRFEQVDVRTRAIQRRLRDVQDLPAPEAQGVAVQGSGALALPDTDEDF